MARASASRCFMPLLKDSTRSSARSESWKKESSSLMRAGLFLFGNIRHSTKKLKVLTCCKPFIQGWGFSQDTSLAADLLTLKCRVHV